jgi:hypothetical protein
MFDVPSFHTSNGSLLLAHEYLNGTAASTGGQLLPWEGVGTLANLSGGLQASANIIDFFFFLISLCHSNYCRKNVPVRSCQKARYHPLSILY